MIITGLGISGSNAGVSQTIDLGPVAAGGTIDYSFSNSDQGVFQYDYDDYAAGYSDINEYTFTAYYGGLTDIGSFTNDLSNNDFLGQGYDNDFDPIFVTAVVPEPSSFALLGLGAIGLAVGDYRRRRSI